MHFAHFVNKIKVEQKNVEQVTTTRGGFDFVKYFAAWDDLTILNGLEIKVSALTKEQNLTHSSIFTA